MFAFETNTRAAGNFYLSVRSYTISYTIASLLGPRIVTDMSELLVEFFVDSV